MFSVLTQRPNFQIKVLKGRLAVPCSLRRHLPTHAAPAVGTNVLACSQEHQNSFLANFQTHSPLFTAWAKACSRSTERSSSLPVHGPGPLYCLRSDSCLCYMWTALKSVSLTPKSNCFGILKMHSYSPNIRPSRQMNVRKLDLLRPSTAPLWVSLFL